MRRTPSQTERLRAYLENNVIARCRVCHGDPTPGSYHCARCGCVPEAVVADHPEPPCRKALGATRDHGARGLAQVVRVGIRELVVHARPAAPTLAPDHGGPDGSVTHCLATGITPETQDVVRSGWGAIAATNGRSSSCNCLDVRPGAWAAAALPDPGSLTQQLSPRASLRGQQWTTLGRLGSAPIRGRDLGAGDYRGGHLLLETALGLTQV